MCLNKAICCTRRITGRIYEALGSVFIDVQQTGRSDGAKIKIQNHLSFAGASLPTCASVFLQALVRDQRQWRYLTF